MTILRKCNKTGYEFGINGDGNLYLCNEDSGYNLSDTPENRKKIERDFEKYTQPDSKIFYAVTSTFYDDGRVTAVITDSVEAETRPENGSSEKSNRDIYTDWFDTPEEAVKFVQEAQEA